MKLALKVNDADNVATIFAVVQKGEQVEVRDKGGESSVVSVNHDIPYGHKIALATISPGDRIFKYGEVIGKATVTINQGDHVHVQNLDSTRGRGDIAKGD